MKKTYKYTIVILISIIVLLAIMYYLLIPKNFIDTNSENIKKTDVLKESYIKNLKVKPDGFKIKTDIVLTQNSLNNIGNLLIKQSQNDDIESIFMKIEDKGVKSYIPYKLMGLINTQIELYAIPDVEKNNVKIKIDNVKLGKINLNDKMVETVINKNFKDVGIKSKDGYVIINKDKLNPFIIEKIILENKKIDITLEVPIEDLVKIINNYGLKS